jgi:hypothetical protein
MTVTGVVIVVCGVFDLLEIVFWYVGGLAKFILRWPG